MHHNFDILIITMHGVCNNCKKNMSSSESLSREEMKQSTLGEVIMATAKFENAFKKLEEHECSGST
jgi:hypothetical protein